MAQCMDHQGQEIVCQEVLGVWCTCFLHFPITWGPSSGLFGPCNMFPYLNQKPHHQISKTRETAQNCSTLSSCSNTHTTRPPMLQGRMFSKPGLVQHLMYFPTWNGLHVSWTWNANSHTLFSMPLISQNPSLNLGTLRRLREHFGVSLVRNVKRRTVFPSLNENTLCFAASSTRTAGKWPLLPCGGGEFRQGCFRLCLVRVCCPHIVKCQSL